MSNDYPYNASDTTLSQPQSGKSLIKPMNRWVEEGISKGEPTPLWHKLWFDGEVCCLFADTNMGKSIYATQIAEHIADEFGTVLYYDFEMSDRQLGIRYGCSDRRHYFHKHYLRAEITDKSVCASVDSIIAEIENGVLASGAKYLIIDNITWLSVQTESGDSAGELMQRIIDLRNRLGISILVLAHTPKREPGTPLTQNSLAGSKRLANFMDSIFCIGKVEGKESYRYIKQIKARSCGIEYGEDNVLVVEIVADRTNIYFAERGHDCESKLIRLRRTNGIPQERQQAIAEMLQQGKTYKEIIAQIGGSERDIAKVKKNLQNYTLPLPAPAPIPSGSAATDDYSDVVLF